MSVINAKSVPIIIILLIAWLYFFHFRINDPQIMGEKSLPDTKHLLSRSDKISSDGQYIPFYGYTVISHATGPHDYSRIEQFLRDTRTLSKYLAPLPASSYHVTIFDIFTQRNVPAKYASVSGNVPSEHWASAYKILLNDLNAAQNFCYKLTSQLLFHKKKFNIGRNALTVTGQLNSENLVSDLRNQILSIFPNTQSLNVKYHLSLGYWIRKIDDTDIESINNELDKLWPLINDEYPLQAPDVCYFELMTKFTPVSYFES